MSQSVNVIFRRCLWICLYPHHNYSHDYVYDVYENSSLYYINDSSYGSGTYVLKKNVFKVVKTENVLPSVKITDVKFQYKKLYAPSTFKISVKVEDPSNIIDVVYIFLRHHLRHHYLLV